MPSSRPSSAPVWLIRRATNITATSLLPSSMAATSSPPQAQRVALAQERGSTSGSRSDAPSTPRMPPTTKAHVIASKDSLLQ
ncbi:MAG TPA: hypothetical protein VIM30_16050 [Candidatus Limnocylindrales bacterium]